MKLCSALKHENLLHFVSAWGNPETDELVMITEIVTGGSLRQYLKKIGRPKLMVVKNWARDILKGLEYLHSQQPPIMHRDLKPDNIFVMSHNADIRIGDFGLSTAIRNSLNNTFLGTPEYMAPEIFESNYGVTVDIYSFGMCLTEICTLKPPYYEFDNLGSVCKAIIEGVQPKSYTMITDPEVKEFIALCLQRAEDRPTASQLLNHPFLIVDKNDPKVHKPVQCAD